MQALPVTAPAPSLPPKREEAPDPQDARFGAVMASLLPFQAAPMPEPPPRPEPPAAEGREVQGAGGDAPRPEPRVEARPEGPRPPLAEAAPAPSPAGPPEAPAPPAGPPPAPKQEENLPPGAGLPLPAVEGVPEGIPAHAAAPALPVPPPPLSPKATIRADEGPLSASAVPAKAPAQALDTPLGKALAQPELIPVGGPEPGVKAFPLSPMTPSGPPTPVGVAPLPAERPLHALAADLATPVESTPPSPGAPTLAVDPKILARNPEQTPMREGVGQAVAPLRAAAPPSPPSAGPSAPEAASPTSEAPKSASAEPLTPRPEGIRVDPPKAEVIHPEVARTPAPGPLREPLGALPAAAPVAEVVAAPRTLPSPVVTQVEGTLRWMVKGPVPEARLQLHPESLGKVSIELKVEQGQVHAKVLVQEPAAMQALQEGRASLEAALKQSGLQLGSFDLQQGGGASHHAPEPHPAPLPSGRGEEGRPHAARQEAPPGPLPRGANPRRIELYA